MIKLFTNPKYQNFCISGLLISIIGIIVLIILRVESEEVARSNVKFSLGYFDF